jgi:hypothetical protein
VEVKDILLQMLCSCDRASQTVKVKNQLDATKYAVLLSQHVSGTNMPIIRSAINNLGGHTWKDNITPGLTLLHILTRAGHLKAEHIH